MFFHFLEIPTCLILSFSPLTFITVALPFQKVTYFISKFNVLEWERGCDLRTPERCLREVPEEREKETNREFH
jgi:hypothetical protein